MNKLMLWYFEKIKPYEWNNNLSTEDNARLEFTQNNNSIFETLILIILSPYIIYKLLKKGGIEK